MDLGKCTGRAAVCPIARPRYLWCLVHKKRTKAVAPTGEPMHYPPTNAPFPCQSTKNVLRGIAAANVEIEKTAVTATTIHNCFEFDGEYKASLFRFVRRLLPPSFSLIALPSRQMWRVEVGFRQVDHAEGRGIACSRGLIGHYRVSGPGALFGEERAPGPGSFLIGPRCFCLTSAACWTENASKASKPADGGNGFTTYRVSSHLRGLCAAGRMPGALFRQDVLSTVDETRRPEARAADPFGSVHLLLFGDFKQLTGDGRRFFIAPPQNICNLGEGGVSLLGWAPGTLHRPEATRE